ncbi:hypothetical protein [Bradyrhizobium sp.]|jgi:hypothetical protein|uniref:hypothetical protein n=1 Tax=Bradyrhizobium sp. TaxID=376 RepID=UPI002DDDBB58|nr:hypothetical protein [Bradyrhizobium sp.]HEV2153149.1 hypothetical protein [Bradyrhizobium sp.]
MEDFDGLSDHFILRMYEFIRHQVHADAAAGTHLVGVAARQRAERLFKEIERRGLFCKPIEWPRLSSMADDR